MGLSVSTVAPTRRLTTPQAFEAMLGQELDHDVVGMLIDQASSAIESYCCRTFARQLYVETLPGFGSIHLKLQHAPVVAVSAVTQGSSVITDHEISDADRGVLYRQSGWYWTAQALPGLTAWQRWPSGGTPLAGEEEPSISVTYAAGYVLPGQNLLAVSTVSVDAIDDSFNDSASGFPALLKAGDLVAASGFSTVANNGTFAVIGVPTASKILVSAALTTEAAAAGRNVRFAAPAHVRRFDDVERACLEVVKTWWSTRTDSANVTERALGSASVKYGTDAGGNAGIPASVVGLLRAWIKVRR